MPHGALALRRKPGVEIYDAAGKLIFYSNLDVLTVTVNEQAA
jgi:hypothetical protein